MVLARWLPAARKPSPLRGPLGPAARYRHLWRTSMEHRLPAAAVTAGERRPGPPPAALARPRGGTAALAAGGGRSARRTCWQPCPARPGAPAGSPGRSCANGGPVIGTATPPHPQSPANPRTGRQAGRWASSPPSAAGGATAPKREARSSGARSRPARRSPGPIRALMRREAPGPWPQGGGDDRVVLGACLPRHRGTRQRCPQVRRIPARRLLSSPRTPPSSSPSYLRTRSCTANPANLAGW